MIFNEHSDLEGKHAFLSPSKYHWVNYDSEKLNKAFKSAAAKDQGTKLHEYANQAIRLGVRQANAKKTLNMYINDCIKNHMRTEQVLYYSDNAFGTCDAIRFDDNKLDIFDLKTGETKANIMQLYIYAALFCLEYNVDPYKLTITLRIYQSNDIKEEVGNPDIVYSVMNTIVIFDDQINKIKKGELK